MNATNNSVVDLALTGDQQFTLLITTFLTVFTLKLSLIVVAMVTIYLGYKLLAKGIQGEFKFNAQMTGVKADLVSASPGTFFVFMGVVILVTAITTKYQAPVTQKVSTSTATTSTAKPQAQGGNANDEWIPEDNPFSSTSSDIQH